MKLTENDLRVLTALAQYYVLSAAQIRRICFPLIRDARAVRRRLSRLVANRFIARTSVNIAFSTGNAGPAYFPTDRGCEALAVYYSDDSWYATNTRAPRLDRLYHWLDISEAHWIMDRAVDGIPAVTMVRWINEWQPVTDADGNASGFVLHTQFCEQPRPLSCSPDAAFLLDVDGHRRVYYAEIDRGTTGARRIAASKMKGYAELARVQGHRRHFQDTTFDDFSVLLLTVNARHRDRIMAEVTKKTDHRPDLWLFASREDLLPDSALTASIFVDCQGHSGPLLDPSALPPSSTSLEGAPESSHAS